MTSVTIARVPRRRGPFLHLSVVSRKKPRGGLRAAATQRRARRPSSHLHRLARSSRVRRRVFALLRARIPNARSRARSSVAVLASEQWPQCRPPLASFRRGSRRRVNRRRINRARRRRRPERFRARPSPPSRLLPRARCAVVHLARIPPPSRDARKNPVLPMNAQKAQFTLSTLAIAEI